MGARRIAGVGPTYCAPENGSGLYLEPARIIVGKQAKVVKTDRFFARFNSTRSRQSAGLPATPETFCNRTTTNCMFSLDTTRREAQNPDNFFRLFSGPQKKGGTASEEVHTRIQATQARLLP